MEAPSDSPSFGPSGMEGGACEEAGMGACLDGDAGLWSRRRRDQRRELDMAKVDRRRGHLYAVLGRLAIRLSCLVPFTLSEALVARSRKMSDLFVSLHDRPALALRRVGRQSLHGCASQLLPVGLSTNMCFQVLV